VIKDGICIGCNKNDFEYVCFRAPLVGFHFHHISDLGCLNTYSPSIRPLTSKERIGIIAKAVCSLSDVEGVYCWGCARKAIGKKDMLQRFYTSSNRQDAINCPMCNKTRYYLKDYDFSMKKGIMEISKSDRETARRIWKAGH